MLFVWEAHRAAKKRQYYLFLSICNGDAIYRVITYVVRISDKLTLLNVTASHESYRRSALLLLKDTAGSEYPDI